MNFAPRPALLGKQHLAVGKMQRPVSTKAVAERLAAGTANGSANGSINGAQTDIHGNQVVYGPTMNVGGHYAVKEDAIEPPSAEVQAILDERGIDLEVSGLKHLSNKARVSHTLLMHFSSK